MRRLFSTTSTTLLQRYCAGVLAVLLVTVYSVPGFAACPCCDSMDVESALVPDETVPSCHMAKTGDGTTEEIASVTEEIASVTEEISSCHETEATVPARPNAFSISSMGCTGDCMPNAQAPAVASPGMVDSHSSSSKVHPIALSDLVFPSMNPHAMTSPVHPQTSGFYSIHVSSALVPLRI